MSQMQRKRTGWPAEVKPTLVYCAAYTAADAAEDEGKELDYAINVTGTEMGKASETWQLYEWLNRLRF